MNRRLYRSRTDSVLGGVAGGVAEYLDIDPSIVRVVWAVLAIVTGGLFLLLYIVMWIVVPEGPIGSPMGFSSTPPPPSAPASSADADAPAAEGTPAAAADGPSTARAPAWGSGWQGTTRRRDGSAGAWIFGLILIALGVWFLVDEYIPSFDSRFVWPVALVVVGVVLLLVSLRRRT